VDAFHPLDWIAIAVYLVFALAAGTLLTRRASGSTDDFYLAGRSLPWWVAGTSLVATTFAADTPLFVAGLVRTDGIAGNWLWWSFVVGGTLWFLFLAGWWRRLELTTNAEFTEVRYSGPQAKALRGFYGAYHTVVTNTIVLVWVLLAMLKIVRAVLGLDAASEFAGVPADVWIVAAAVGMALLYSILAGLWGVVVTDLFQFVLAIAGAVVLAWKAVEACGGLGEMTATLEQQFPDKLALLPSPGPGGPLDPAFWSQGFTAFLVTVCLVGWLNKNADGSGQAVQRFLAAKDEDHARGGALWFQLAHYVLRSWPWILVGLASLILLPDAELPLTSSGAPDHEAAYPMLMRQLLGPGLFGLLCASFLAAFMSTLDTHFNTASAYAVNDLYRRFLVRDRGPRHYVAVGRLVEVLVGVLGAALALRADSIKDLFTFSLQLVAGLGPALFLRWVWWRVNAWTEISGLLTSTALAVGLSFVPEAAWPAAPFNGWAEGASWDFSGKFLLISALSTAVMVAVTLLTRPVPREQLAAFHAKVQPFGFWRPFRAEGARRPSSVVPLLLGWAGGMAATWGPMLAIGQWLLGRDPLPALLAGAAGAALLAWSWRRTVAGPAAEAAA
jgi:SSS family solute:Na+ symporter